MREQMVKLIRTINQITKKAEPLAIKYFLITFLWGIVMVFLIPPFRSSDEIGHYIMASSLTKGRFRCDEGHAVLDESKIKFMEFFDVTAEDVPPIASFDASKLKTYKDTDTEKMGKYPTRLCRKIPVVHTIPGLGIKVGNILGLNELNSFYLGRLFNLTFGIFLVALAIHLAPFGKHVFFALGLLPSYMYHASTINYDAIDIPARFLFFAYIYYLGQKKVSITKAKSKFLFLITLFATSIKMAYQPVILLSYLLKDKFPKGKFRLFGMMVFVLILSLLITVLPKVTFEGGIGSVAKPSINIFDQLYFVVAHPFFFLKAMIVNMITSFFGFAIVFLGFFDWQKYYHLPINYLFIVFFILLFIRSDTKFPKFSLKERMWHLTVFLITVFSIYIPLYAAETPVGSFIIKGISGRYFISIFPLFVFALIPGGVRVLSSKERRIINIICAILLIVYIIITFLSIYHLYYLHRWLYRVY